MKVYRCHGWAVNTHADNTERVGQTPRESWHDSWAMHYMVIVRVDFRAENGKISLDKGQRVSGRNFNTVTPLRRHSPPQACQIPGQMASLVRCNVW